MPHATAAATTPAPSLSPELEAQEILLPQVVSSATLLNTGVHATTAGAALDLLQEVLQEVRKETLPGTCRKRFKQMLPQDAAGNWQSVAGIGDAE